MELESHPQQHPKRTDVDDVAESIERTRPPGKPDFGQTFDVQGMRGAN